MTVLWTKTDINSAELYMVQRIIKSGNKPDVIIGVALGGVPFSFGLLSVFEYYQCQDIAYRIVKATRVERWPYLIVETSSKTLSWEVKDKRVLIADGICDTGGTLAEVKQLLREAGAAQVQAAALVKRCVPPSLEKTPPICDFWGLELTTDDYIYGYGMDKDGKRRGLPCIETEKSSCKRE